MARRWPASSWPADRLARAIAVAMAAALLAGYAAYLLGGAGSGILAGAVGCVLVVALLAMLRHPWWLLATTGSGTLLGYVAVYSLVIEWDAQSIWFLHARLIHLGAGPAELLALAPPFSHPGYPKLLALTAASVADLAGVWNAALPKLAVPLLYAAPLLYLAGAWRTRLPRLLALGLVFLLLGRFLWNGYADGLLAASTVAAMVAGCRWLEHDEALDGYAFAVLAALLPALKTEGLLALAAVGAGLAARCLVSGEWRRAPDFARRFGVPMVITLAVSLGWFAIVAGQPTELLTMTRDMQADRAWARLWDGESAAQVWQALVVYEFRYLWLLAALTLLTLGTASTRRAVLPFVVAALLFTGCLAAVYLGTGHDLAWHLATSARRATMTPVLLLAMALVPAPAAGRTGDTPG